MFNMLAVIHVCSAIFAVVVVARESPSTIPVESSGIQELSGIIHPYPKGLPCKIINGTLLDCSNRKLQNITALKLDQDIKRLDLSRNQLQSVNAREHLIRFGPLEEIKLNRNSLRSVSFSTSLPLPLVRLDLSHNIILNIKNDTFAGLKELKILDMSHQYRDLLDRNTDYLRNSALFNFPDATSVFSELCELEELDLSGSPIGSVPDSFFQGLSNLIYLDMSDTRLVYLPSGLFADLTSLQHLDLSFNYLANLTDTLFANLVNLKFLDVHNSYMSVTSVPETLFADLVNLEYLDLAANGIVQFPARVFANLSNLKHLNLCFNDIISLPNTMFIDLVGLEYLDLSVNNISKLPNILFMNQKSLKYLDLSLNFISNLPETSFMNLSSLTSLNISWNSLTSTPCQQIEHLRMLSVLQMAYNYFEFITCSIVDAINLTEMHMSYKWQDAACTREDNWDETRWSRIFSRLPARLCSLHLIVRPCSVLQPVAKSSI